MLSISLLLATASPAPLTGAACPPTHRGVGLSYSQVVDGPPEEMAILRGTDNRRVRGATVSTWDVGYIYKKGRQVHLVCEYAKGVSLVVKVARPVQTCTYTERGRRESLSCR